MKYPILRNKPAALILCICILAAYIPVIAENDTVYIKSAKDFNEFSKNCTLDTWSVGKTVVLENDIDLSGGFTPVPYFAGTFDGGGYTIYGMSYYESGSNVGLFRYIGGGGTVKDFNLKGVMEPTGTKTTVGAVVGENNGAVINISYDGIVKGKTNVGAIAGINQGQIMNCTSSGTVYGEHYVGGTAGKNFGTVILCTNDSNVNTVEKEVKLDVESIDFENLRSTENVADITDIGGIAGYSSGIVQSCENNGAVGYEHVGYNIGGICGRQTGYINGCTNNGVINGRKDVGGIVGQMEPYTILKYKKESLEALDGELDKLQDIVDRMINNSKNSKSLVSERLSGTKNRINEARGISESLINRINDRINGEIDNINSIGEEINDTSARLAETIDKILDFTEDMSGAADGIKDIADEYKDEFERIADLFDSDDAQLVSDGLKYLSDAASNLSLASKYIGRGVDRFRTAFGDQRKKKEALSQISEGVRMYRDALEEIKKAADDISKANQGLKDNIKTDNGTVKENLSALIDAVTEGLGSISSNIPGAAEGMTKVIQGLGSLAAQIGDWDVGDLYNGIEYLEIAVDLLRSSMDQLAGAAKNLNGAWSRFKNSAEEAKDILNEDDTKGDRLSDEIDKISGAFGGMRDALRDFNKNPIITYEKTDSVYFEEKDKLSDSISDISDSIDGVKDSVGAFGDIMLNDVQSISDQMSVIFDCLSDSVDEAKNKSTDAEDYIQDVSEYDDQKETKGKAAASENRGSVNADVNVGGIVGSMAVEYDFDPEDDVTQQGEKSLNFLYTTKAVVSGCTNSGNVTARKNCAGGVVGKADLGMVTACMGKGIIKSESGDYTGGVAGQSASVIRGSYAKCSLSGENYVGGIAGSGERIYNSYSISHFDKYEEYAGAIAGEIKNAYSGNLFVGSDLGGVDNVSYAGKAEEISYEAFVAMEGIPNDFRHFTVIFKADDTVVGEAEFEYGKGLTADRIPAVPKKDGCYGLWDKESFDNLTYDETVEAVYDSYIQAIESKQKRENGLSVVVADGDFSSKSVLLLKEESPEGNEAERWSVSIENAGDGEINLHYLPPEKNKNVRIMMSENGKETKVSCSKDGKYTVFAVPGGSATFTVYKKTNTAAVVICISAGLIGALLILLLMKKKKIPRFYGRTMKS